MSVFPQDGTKNECFEFYLTTKNKLMKKLWLKMKLLSRVRDEL